MSPRLPLFAVIMTSFGPGASSGPRSDAEAPSAGLSCDHAPAPGRVRCSVEAHVPGGETITWGDVLLVEAAPFVEVLRGRIGPREATVRAPGAWRWELAVVARAAGRGELAGRVRLVVCTSGGPCVPYELPVSVQVEVGP